MLKNKSISRIFFYYKYFPFSNESKILNNPYGIFREIVLLFSILFKIVWSYICELGCYKTKIPDTNCIDCITKKVSKDNLMWLCTVFY